MHMSLEGVFRAGRVELTEPVSGIEDETRVIVTFLSPNYIDLKEHGISEEQAARIRAQLGSFAEEWESPEMDIYDDYDNLRRSV